MKSFLLFFGILMMINVIARADDSLELKAVKDRACYAGQRVFDNQRRLAREKEYAALSGVLDKENAYRAGRGIVEGRRELMQAFAEFEKLAGRKYSEKDIRACPYFSE